MKRIKAPSLPDSTVTADVVRQAVARGAKRKARSTSARLPTVIVEIDWGGAVERLRLDLHALKERSVKTLTTTEWWQYEKMRVTYFPRVVRFVSDVDGVHLLELVYVKSEHSHLRGKKGILWGTLTLELPVTLTNPSVDWSTEPPGDLDDGPPRGGKVHVEEPSRTKPIPHDIRIAQAAFKKSVLTFGTCCELTQESTLAALDAAHVHEVRDGGTDEPENGLLLRTDLHRLFDSGYFWFDSKGWIQLHPKISKTYVKELRFIRLPQETLKRIEPY